MKALCVAAVGAVSAQGRGRAAYHAGPVGEPARTVLGEDAVLAAGGLAKPRCGRAALTDPAAGGCGGSDSDDRATLLLADALGQLLAELDRDEPGWRDRRLGVCVGTSSGGMCSAEQLFLARHEGRQASAELAQRATYFAPLDDALRGAGLSGVKRCQVVAACASSTIAIGLAMRWLDRGACDLVITGGYDAVSLFVAAGFEALRATSGGLPQPFRLKRDGMLLGEGAGLLALVREAKVPRWWLRGFGAACDAHHITAPARDGAGLVRAARAALADAGCDPGEVALVSAHGTATPYNDSAEAKAIATICPTPPVVHPFKAQIGHTLGAAGVLELLSAADALVEQVAPAAFGQGALDPEAEVRLLERAEPQNMSTVLKLSAAFGGVTAALLVGRQARERPQRERRTVHLLGHAQVSDYERGALAAELRMARDRLARIDDLGQLSLAAVAALAAQVGVEALTGAGVVSGHALATLDTNERFESRLLTKGARWVDPRLFPATSPNAPAGHCAIALGLTGPCFAVDGGLGGAIEGLLAAAELVAAGDAERMIVVAADDAGPLARRWMEQLAPGRRLERGAVAVLIGARAPAGCRAVDLDQPLDHAAVAPGHLALLDWLRGA